MPQEPVNPYETTTELTSDFMGPGEPGAVQRAYQFSLILQAAGAMPQDDSAYWQDPAAWGDHYRAWEAAGSPQPPEGSDPDWDAFLEALLEL